MAMLVALVVVVDEFCGKSEHFKASLAGDGFNDGIETTFVETNSFSLIHSSEILILE